VKGGELASINVQPPVLDLSLYAGDGISFRLICKDETGSPVNITGTVEAQVRVDRSPTSSPIVEFTAGLTQSNQGTVMLSLTGDQTQTIMDDPSSKNGKFTGVWDVQWTPGGQEPRTLIQGKVECFADVTR
jgi:hypothetical protein